MTSFILPIRVASRYVPRQKARETFTCNFRQFSGEKNPQTPMVTTFFTLYYVPTDPKPKTESVMIHSLHPKNPLFTTLPDINPLLLSNITNTELGGSSGSSIRGRSNQSGSDIQRWQCFYQRASFICHLRRTHGAAPHPRTLNPYPVPRRYPWRFGPRIRTQEAPICRVVGGLSPKIE